MVEMVEPATQEIVEVVEQGTKKMVEIIEKSVAGSSKTSNDEGKKETIIDDLEKDVASLGAKLEKEI